jgi:nitroreductase
MSHGRLADKGIRVYEGSRTCHCPYRYHLDTGHVCQNLCLEAETVGCGTCAIAASDEDDMNTIPGINGADQFVIYLATVVKKDKTLLMTG